MKFSSFALSLAILGMAAVPSHCQQGTVGGQITLSKPQGDVGTAMDGKIGFGLGLHLFRDLQNGHVLVPRIDLVRYSRSLEGVDVTDTNTKVGLDYNYFLGKKANEGAYLVAGLAYNSLKQEITFQGNSGSLTKDGLGFGFGAGYMWSAHLGGELKYESLTLSRTGGGTFSAPSLNATLILRY